MANFLKSKTLKPKREWPKPFLDGKVDYCFWGDKNVSGLIEILCREKPIEPNPSRGYA